MLEYLRTYKTGLGERMARRIFKEILAGLKYLHSVVYERLNIGCDTPRPQARKHPPPKRRRQDRRLWPRRR